jgi:hypothetical protein
MLFRESLGRGAALAISQPAHAWISGQLLRAWADRLDEPLLLAAEQHDLGWLDWETAPSFDPLTGRPHLFRAVSAAVHAPMWARGVERALSAWGARVALLVSRHGTLVYSRYADRERMAEAGAAAVDHYLETQGGLQAGWARALGLDAAVLAHDTGLIALADTLSLALCGELRTPLDVQAPDRTGGTRSLRLTRPSEDWTEFTLSPWPFGDRVVVVEAEARPLPAAGRFADEAEMRAWTAGPERVVFHTRLTPT